jgi:small-conductance mechanosensitive channel
MSPRRGALPFVALWQLAASASPRNAGHCCKSLWREGCLTDARVSRRRRITVCLVGLLALGGVTFPARLCGAEVLEEDDLSTPRRAVATFLDGARRRDFARALAVLDVSERASTERKARATELARELEYVLSHSARFELDALSDDPQGRPEDGAETEIVTEIRGSGGAIPIVLVRPRSAPARWVFSTGTLTNVPELYRLRGPSVLEPYVPAVLREETFGMERWQWLGLPVALVAAVLLARLLVFLVARAFAHLAARTQAHWDDELVAALRSPGRLLAAACAFVPLAHFMSLPAAPRLVCWRAAGTAGVVALGWSAIRIVRVVSNLLERRALRTTESVRDEAIRLRAVRTRVRVLRRVVSVVLGALAGAVVLLQFDVVRQFGVSILASAGVAGIVLGLAAQRTLGSLIAGIQLSFTQPISIGDDVIVENEFGTIEEITLTYVVVKVWDERRLIVPMTRFLEQPFQNWTKTSSQLHGTVLLYADFSLPVDELRAELERLLAGNARWDGRTRAVHVTNATDRTLEVRVLVSADSGGKLFELRAELRERLMTWLVRHENGRYLPRTRLDGVEHFVRGLAGESATPSSGRRSASQSRST